MSGNQDDLVKYRINRAFETIKEAEVLIENEFWNAAINRIYYACFYAVSGLLLQKGLDISTHKGIRQLFGLHFVQPGLVSKQMARFFSDLYDRRQTGDYDDYIVFDKEVSVSLLSLAKEFILEMHKLIYQNLE